MNSNTASLQSQIDSLEETVFAEQVQGYSLSRTSNLTANTDFTVGSYIVGSKQLNVYVNGLRCQNGIDYNEIGTEGEASTKIQFVDTVGSNVCIVWTIGR